MSERKPWEETWRAGGPEGSELHYGDGEPAAGCVDLGVGEVARARLAAAAPDLYRALAAVEFAGGSDHTGDLCPSCSGYDPTYGEGWAHHRPNWHQPTCALAAALRKARGEP